MSTQFITDDKGERTAVILPVGEYEELMDDLNDLATIAERRDEPTIPFAAAPRATSIRTRSSRRREPRPLTK